MKEVQVFLHKRSKSEAVDFSVYELKNVANAVGQLGTLPEEQSTNEEENWQKALADQWKVDEKMFGNLAKQGLEKSMSLNASKDMGVSPPSGTSEIGDIMAIISSDPNMRLKMGAVQLPDGSVYEGEWLNGMKDGEGILITP